jgi:hypothetical protein
MLGGKETISVTADGLRQLLQMHLILCNLKEESSVQEKSHVLKNWVQQVCRTKAKPNVCCLARLEHTVFRHLSPKHATHVYWINAR